MEELENEKKVQDNKKILIIAIAALTVVIIACIGFFLWLNKSHQEELAKVNAVNEQLKAENEQVKLENEQVQLSNEFQALEEQFQALEIQSQAIDIPPSAIKDPDLRKKYEDSKKRIEQLKKELDEERKNGGKNIAKIKELEARITELTGLVKDLYAQITQLKKENEGLVADTTRLRSDNRTLTSRVTQVNEEKKELQAKVTLAEKLNVTGVTFTALNKKGKNEKKIEKAKQLKVTFTIPQNNTTPPGVKNLYLRITSPEGSLLGNAGSFTFEGSNLQCSARKQIEYGGDEIGVTMYWDVNTTLNKGEYLVEIFTDGYRLASRRYNMNK